MDEQDKRTTFLDVPSMTACAAVAVTPHPAHPTSMDVSMAGGSRPGYGGKGKACAGAGAGAGGTRQRRRCTKTAAFAALQGLCCQRPDDSRINGRQ